MPSDITPETVAQWMVDQIQPRKDLFQMDAVSGIAKKFGAEFTYTNKNGNPAIDKNVLKIFNALSAETVVWEPRGKYWRWREDRDKEGRSQG